MITLALIIAFIAYVVHVTHTKLTHGKHVRISSQRNGATVFTVKYGPFTYVRKW